MRLTDTDLKKMIHDERRVTLSFIISEISDDGLFAEWMKKEVIEPRAANDIISSNMVNNRFPVLVNVLLEPTMFFEGFEGEITYIQYNRLHNELYMHIEFRSELNPEFNIELLIESIDRVSKDYHYTAKMVLRRERMFGKTILRECDINIVNE